MVTGHPMANSNGKFLGEGPTKPVLIVWSYLSILNGGTELGCSAAAASTSTVPVGSVGTQLV